MSDYRAADGHDNEPGLSLLSVQPRSGAIHYAVRRYTAGGVYEDGYATQDLIYDTLSRDDLNTLRAEFGLSDSVIFNDITVRTRQNDDTFANFNARVIGPVLDKRDAAFWRSVVFRLINLEAL